MCHILYASTPACILDPHQSKTLSWMLIMRLWRLDDDQNINTEKLPASLHKLHKSSIDIDWSVTRIENLVKIIESVHCMPHGFTSSCAWQISLSGFIALLLSIAWYTEDAATLNVLAISLSDLLNLGLVRAVNHSPLERIMGILTPSNPFAYNNVHLKISLLRSKDTFWTASRSMLSAIARWNRHSSGPIPTTKDNFGSQMQRYFSVKSRRDYLRFCHLAAPFRLAPLDHFHYTRRLCFNCASTSS